MMRSYTSERLGPLKRMRELLLLYRVHARSAREGAKSPAKAVQLMEKQVLEHTGLSLADVAILDVGCGGALVFSTYLAQRNNVTGIDMDIVPRPYHVGDYYVMLRRNGWLRVAKTLGRKATGADRAFRRSIKSDLHLKTLRRPTVLSMDAGHMTFPDSTFDFVYSISAFEHLEEPERVVHEVARVLRPGATAYLHVHLYTHDTGAHDPRVMNDETSRMGLPAWAHLRPHFRVSRAAQCVLESHHPHAMARALLEDPARLSFREDG